MSVSLEALKYYRWPSFKSLPMYSRQSELQTLNFRSWIDAKIDVFSRTNGFWKRMFQIETLKWKIFSRGFNWEKLATFSIRTTTLESSRHCQTGFTRRISDRGLKSILRFRPSQSALLIFKSSSHYSFGIKLTRSNWLGNWI